MQKKTKIILAIILIIFSVALLLLGIIIRNTICSGIPIDIVTEPHIVDPNRELGPGVYCMGEEEPSTLEGGSVRTIWCNIYELNSTDYNISLISFTWESGGSSYSTEEVIITEGWSGTSPPGNEMARIAVLDVPKDIGPSTALLEFEITKNPKSENPTSETKYLRFNLISKRIKLQDYIC
jgi:hypothetical protein